MYEGYLDSDLTMREQVAVFLRNHNHKQTGDVSDPIRFFLSKAKAREIERRSV